jgi:RecA/RadA recombinase
MSKKEMDLASVLADELNKLNKTQTVAYFLDSDAAPANVPGWVSSGCSMLDIAISNRPNGGFPMGRIVEITGLEQCVTEDTIIDVIIETNTPIDIKQIEIREVKQLLEAGKTVRVRSKHGEFVKITDYYEKGLQPTLLVKLDNGYSIKVSKRHRFFTNQGWTSADELNPNVSKIFTDTDTYQMVTEVSNIGLYPIVDIQVDNKEHCYFGNGFLNHNSGKSLLSSHALAETQKAGGVAVLIDTENAVSREFLEAIGVDISKLLYVTADSVEQIFEFIETIIAKVKSVDKDKPVTIVVDSVAAASSKKELAADYDKDGYATDKAIIISKALRKITNTIGRQRVSLIFTNQLRMKMNAMFADPWCVDPLTTKIKIRYKAD